MVYVLDRVDYGKLLLALERHSDFVHLFFFFFSLFAVPLDASGIKLMEDIQYTKRDILSDRTLSVRAAAIAEELERKVTKIHLLRTTKDIQKLLTEGQLDASAAAAIEEERLSKQVRLSRA